VHPIGGEVTFPAPWEADFDAVGEPVVDILPPTSSGWHVSRAVAGNGDAVSSPASLRATLSPQAATAQEGVPELVLGWRGTGGGAALSHLHLLVRVLLPETLADACSRARGDDRHSNEQLAAQASFSLGPLLSAAAETWRRSRPSVGRGLVVDEEGSSASETEVLCNEGLQDSGDLVANACEALIRQGMPEYVLHGGSRQQCLLKCELRVKVMDPKELEQQMRMRRRKTPPEVAARKSKTTPRKTKREWIHKSHTAAALHSNTSQELSEHSRSGGWFSHHRSNK